MPDREAKSHHVNNGKAVQSINSHQSPWLTHWTGTRIETSTHDHLTQLRDDHDFKKHLSGIEIASDVDLTMSLKKPNSQSFPFFKLGQGSVKEVQALGPQVSAFNVANSSRKSHLQPEEVSQIPTEQVKYHMFFGEQFTGSPSHMAMDQGAYKLDSHPKSERSEMPSFLRQNNTAFLQTDPSTSSHRSPALIEEQYKRMQKHIGMGFFPHQTGSTENTKSRTMHHGQCSFHNAPHFVHDVEMTSMCTPTSSLEALAGGLHSFSRTTHSLLITKQTDVKVYQESKIFRESRVSTQFDGEALRELKCSPPHYNHGQRGVKIQLLDSSDYESQENVAAEDVQKNESSADTDAMDMESFKENHLSGVHLSQPNKDIMVESNLPFSPPIATSSKKDTPRKRKIELPDINIEISTQQAASSSTDKAEPCTSRTQSLDMNTLHFNVDQTSKSKSDEWSDTNPGSEPGSRWIKRLKLRSSSSHPFGTKKSKLVKPSSNDKSESLEIQIGESSSLDTKRECNDITLSHSWIQRWSHNQNQKNLKNVKNCKPGNNKLATDELQKKQFPSIAAMALMGKAMGGFQQCEFEKKESFVVWNTKAFE